MRILRILFLLALIIPLSASPTDKYEIARVIDGDTFVLDNGESVRLIGIDTPEYLQPSGAESKAFAEKLLLGKLVQLEYDTQQRDKYGRILAYVFLDDLFVNAELIREGYARAYTQYPFKSEYKELFLKLEKEAQLSKTGLWAIPAVKTDEDLYWLNTNSNAVHNSSCRWYGNTRQGIYTKEPTGKDCSICGGAHQTATIQKNESDTQDDPIVYKNLIDTSYS